MSHCCVLLSHFMGAFWGPVCQKYWLPVEEIFESCSPKFRISTVSLGNTMTRYPVNFKQYFEQFWLTCVWYDSLSILCPCATHISMWDFLSPIYTTMKSACSSWIKAWLIWLRDTLFFSVGSPVHAHMSQASYTFWNAVLKFLLRNWAWLNMLCISVAIACVHLWTFFTMFMTALWADTAISVCIFVTAYGTIIIYNLSLPRSSFAIMS